MRPPPRAEPAPAQPFPNAGSPAMLRPLARLLAGSLLVLGCQPDPLVRPESPNVLVVVLDDVGLDRLSLYDVAADPPPTPRLTALAAEGVLFRNAWAHPSCSPSRAALLTGRHPRRYGIGRWIDPPDDPVRLPDDEVTLPQLLSTAPEAWDTSLVGKWHLSGFQGLYDVVADDPARKGFDWHGGSLGNLSTARERPEEGDLGYYRWEKDTNGELAIVEEYATTVTASDGIARMEVMREPWLLVVTFNAAHKPTSTPPAHLVLDPGLPDYEQMIQALDTELGRLVDAVPDHTRRPTTVVVVGDNGTPDDWVDPALGSPGSKEEPYELGVRVPFVVTSDLLPERGVVSDALVSITDVFATAAELAGLDPTRLRRPDGRVLVHDSVSLVPYLHDPRRASLRDIMYTETFAPNGAPPYRTHKRGLRTADHKYVRYLDGREELFAFRPDGLEGEELLATGVLSPSELEELDRLRAAADEIDTIGYEYDEQ